MAFVDEEILSQPTMWRQAADLAAQPEVAAVLPTAGESVAVVGCGTSYYMAQAFARLREDGGYGETDAWPASEFPHGRAYDRVVALSRSGTTTEVLRLVDSIPASTEVVAITADPDQPLARGAAHTVSLPFADERSVVQTRFATTALALWRTHLGEDLSASIADAHAVLDSGVGLDARSLHQFTFLGTGWTVGLANEAALKVREASQSWAESYPAMEFRHGPISVIDEHSLVWIFGEAPDGLIDDLVVTGCRIEQSTLDPAAHLVFAQLLALNIARLKGLDPDAPRNLTRSIILQA